jgi:hypothetical protein
MRKVRATTIYSDSAMKVIAVESLRSYRNADHRRCHLYGELRPLAVVVCASDSISAVDINGRAMDVDRLSEEVPSLRTTISSWRGGR